MMISLLAVLFISPSIFAASKEYETALRDSEETFQQYQKSVAELIDSITDSPAKFESGRNSLTYNLDNYCDSMKRFPAIHKKCLAQKELSIPLLDKRYAELKAAVKDEEHGGVFQAMQDFNEQAIGLRVIQENGEEIHPDLLQKKRIALEKEMAEYCPKLIDKDLQKFCNRQTEKIKITLANYEFDLRSRDFSDPPNSKKVYKDRTPILRCFFQLPNLRDQKLEYKISDPRGRYRFEHLKKTRFGYALNVPLAKIENSQINRGLSIQKKFADPRNSKTYTIYISPTYVCGPGIKNPPDCKANGIGIVLYSEDPDKGERSARASFMMKKDQSFDFMIPADDLNVEEFGVACALAAKMRTGGWIYSDNEFDAD